MALRVRAAQTQTRKKRLGPGTGRALRLLGLAAPLDERHADAREHVRRAHRFDGRAGVAGGVDVALRECMVLDEYQAPFLLAWPTDYS